MLVSPSLSLAGSLSLSLCLSLLSCTCSSQEEKFLSVKTTGDKFQQTIATSSSCLSVLFAVGFKDEGDHLVMDRSTDYLRHLHLALRFIDIFRPSLYPLSRGTATSHVNGEDKLAPLSPAETMLISNSNARTLRNVLVVQQLVDGQLYLSNTVLHAGWSFLSFSI